MVTELVANISRAELQAKSYADGLAALLEAAQKLMAGDWQVVTISNADGHVGACYVAPLRKWVILETLDGADLDLPMFYVTFGDAQGRVTTVVIEAGA